LGVIDYIQKGGLLMWPILACSIIGIAVFAERFFYLHRANIHVGEFLKGLSNLIQRRNFAEALHEAAGTPGPVARVIHAALVQHAAPRSELREIVQEAGQLEVPRLERFLGVLATLAFLRHDCFPRRLRHCHGTFRRRLQKSVDRGGWSRRGDADFRCLQLPLVACQHNAA
jgi:hypothetical protein